MGAVVELSFVDADVMAWQCGVRPGAGAQGSGNAHMLWVLCENALFECDLYLRRTRMITSDDLKRNAPKCFAAIFPSLVAIGCSDGAIRVWDTYNWVLASTLHSHTRDVLALKVVGAKGDGRNGLGGGEDSSRAAHAHRTSDGVLEGKLRMVSVGLDGAGYLWETTIVGEYGPELWPV